VLDRLDLRVILLLVYQLLTQVAAEGGYRASHISLILEALVETLIRSRIERRVVEVTVDLNLFIVRFFELLLF